MDQFVIFLFAVTSGFAASGATANLYRLFGFRARTRAGRALRLSVLVIAGPSVIFESAVKGLKAGEWKPIGFWLTMALLFYWSLAIGMFVMELSMGLAADYYDSAR